MNIALALIFFLVITGIAVRFVWDWTLRAEHHGSGHYSFKLRPESDYWAKLREQFRLRRMPRRKRQRIAEATGGYSTFPYMGRTLRLEHPQFPEKFIPSIKTIKASSRPRSVFKRSLGWNIIATILITAVVSFLFAKYIGGSTASLVFVLTPLGLVAAGKGMRGFSYDNLLPGTGVVLNWDAPGVDRIVAQIAKGIYGDRVGLCTNVNAQVQIEDVISAVSTAGGGDVVITSTPTYYDIQTHILMAAKTNIRGLGTAVLRMHDNLPAPKATFRFLGATTTNDIKIESLFFDGNVANNALADPTHEYDAILVQDGIASFANRIHILNNTMYNYKTSGVQMRTTSTDIHINGNIVYGTGNVGIELIYSSNSEIANNTLAQTGITHESIELQLCSAVTVTGNTCSGSGLLLFGSNSCVATGNTISFPDNVGEWKGFRLVNTVDPTPSVRNTIANNTVLGQSNAHGYGVTWEDATYNSTFNTIDNNTFYLMHYGVYLRGAETGNNRSNIVTNNKCLSCGIGILLEAGLTTVKDNTIRNSATYGLSLLTINPTTDNLDGCDIEGNIISGSGTNDIYGSLNVVAVLGKNTFTTINCLSATVTWKSKIAIPLEFQYTDVIAGLVTVDMLRPGGLVLRVRAMAAGRVVGMSINSNAARTAGTLTINPTIAGVVGTTVMTLDGANPQSNTVKTAIHQDAFAAGDALGMCISTDAGWLPVTADISGVLYVVYD